MNRSVRTSIVFFILTLSPRLASACPACYGAKDSPMTAGMNAAILVMLGIIGAVLFTIVSIFFLIWRRNKRRLVQLSQEVFVSEQGILRSNHKEGVFEWNNS